jgi:hypothetical protein
MSGMHTYFTVLLVLEIPFPAGHYTSGVGDVISPEDAKVGTKKRVQSPLLAV